MIFGCYGMPVKGDYILWSAHLDFDCEITKYDSSPALKKTQKSEEAVASIEGVEYKTNVQHKCLKKYF